VFRLAYRQAEGLLGSIAGLLGLGLRVPDHTTLSRRAATLDVPRPRSAHAGAGVDSEPLHLLVDSTGLKLCGKGEWLLEKHGTATRRSWRTLHLGVDAGTGRIVASTLTPKGVDDASQVDPLLDQVPGPLASFTGDGAYDQDRVYAGVAERHPEAAVVVPPRATAAPSDTAESAPTQRDGHIQHIARHGRMRWQSASGYNKRARAEATMGRWKQVIGAGRSRSRFRVRSTWTTGGGCARIRMSAGRPRWTSPSTRSTACWTWDAQAMSASPDPKCGQGQCARTPDPCTALTAGGPGVRQVASFVRRPRWPGAPHPGRRGERGYTGDESVLARLRRWRIGGRIAAGLDGPLPCPPAGRALHGLIVPAISGVPCAASNAFGGQHYNTTKKWCRFRPEDRLGSAAAGLRRRSWMVRAILRRPS